MGKFANPLPDDAPKWIGPKPDVKRWNGESEFEAMGVEVPFFRRNAAYQHVKQMGIKDSQRAFDIVQKMAELIERDEPHSAMETAHADLDVTGVYRLLAVMLCEPKPETEEERVLRESGRHLQYEPDETIKVAGRKPH